LDRVDDEREEISDDGEHVAYESGNIGDHDKVIGPLDSSAESLMATSKSPQVSVEPAAVVDCLNESVVQHLVLLENYHCQAMIDCLWQHPRCDDIHSDEQVGNLDGIHAWSLDLDVCVERRIQFVEEFISAENCDCDEGNIYQEESKAHVAVSRRLSSDIFRKLFGDA
jgi:hypothetical protein